MRAGRSRRDSFKVLDVADRAKTIPCKSIEALGPTYCLSIVFVMRDAK